MQAVEASKSSEEFWRDHILRSKEFSGSDRKYCAENDLDAAKFSSYKRKLGFTAKTRRASRAFAEVETMPEVLTQELPDPKWLATLLREFDERR